MDELKQHLKTLAGCGQAGGDVLISTVGLSSLAACVMAALEMGNKEIDIVMCSTAYVFFFLSIPHTHTTVNSHTKKKMLQIRRKLSTDRYFDRTNDSIEGCETRETQIRYSR